MSLIWFFSREVRSSGSVCAAAARAGMGAKAGAAGLASRRWGGWRRSGRCECWRRRCGSRGT